MLECFKIVTGHASIEIRKIIEIETQRKHLTFLDHIKSDSKRKVFLFYIQLLEFKQKLTEPIPLFVLKCRN